MQKRVSFYVVSLCLVALFMMGGCANQNVVKKDEGLAPAPVAKKADQAQAGETQSRQVAANPIMAAVAAPAIVKQTQDSSSTTQLQSALDKIYFDFDSANLSESARTTLTKNASALKASSAKIRIEGNCDERGSAEYNLALGERRAKTAQQYLLTLGIKPERLSTISYGKEKPAVQGSDEAAMAKNRRDELVVMAK